MLHLFGATLFCPRSAASDKWFHVCLLKLLKRSCYAANCVRSVSSSQEAIYLIKELCKLLAKHLTFCLAKFISNDREVIWNCTHACIVPWCIVSIVLGSSLVLSGLRKVHIIGLSNLFSVLLTLTGRGHDIRASSIAND